MPAGPTRLRWAGALALLAVGVALLVIFRPQIFVAPIEVNPPPPILAVHLHETAPPKIATTLSWDERWKRWLERLPAPGNDAELAAEFEKLVAEDPAHALALAQKETDPARRACLLQAVLLLWAEREPHAAAAQARTLSDAERAAGIAAVLAGAAGHPEAAVRLAVEFCRDDPALASEHGYALIAALGRTGEFRAAIRFALGEESAPGDEEHNKWLKAAFAQWAEENPAAAMAAIQELPGAGARFEALEAIAARRVRTDPTGLTEALRSLPAGPDRNLALGQTLRTWVNQDPTTAAAWLARLEPSLELDAGAAAMATQSPILNRRPEVALSWAESIVSAELRSRTLATILQKWAATDQASVLRYVQGSGDLLPEDRALFLTSSGTAPSP